MSQKTVLGARCLGIVVALALMFQFAQPSQTYAQAAITLNPTHGPAGTTVTVMGSGFKAGEMVTISFAGNPAIATATAGSTGTATGTFTATFVVPNGTTPGSYGVTASGNMGTAAVTATPPFTVDPTAGGGSTVFQLAKTVDGYVCGSATGCTANVGENLTYQLSYYNYGAASATGVTITDTLAPGQTFAGASAPCTSSTDASGIVTVTCNLGTVPATAPGNRGAVQIFARLDGTQGNVDNTAYISSASVGGGTPVASNTTYVRVGATCTAANNYCNSCTAANNYCNACNTCTCGACNTCNTCTCGTCNTCNTCTCGACNTCNTCTCGVCNTCNTCTCGVCNTCNTCTCGVCNTCNTCTCGTCNTCTTCACAACNTCTYNWGYCGTCGATSCAPGCTASYCYGPCGTTACSTGCGTSACGTACVTSTCGVSACSYTCGAYGYTVCGVVAGYTPASATVIGTMTVQGVTYSMPAGTNFYPTQVVNGGYYCFIRGTGSFITGCLSQLPTAVTWVGNAPEPGNRRGVPVAV